MKENVDDYFTGDFLKAGDITDKTIATIKKVDEVTIDEETKPVVYFEELNKCLVLNKTNATKIADVAKSAKFVDWIGKRIMMYSTMVPFRGKDVPAIRISEPGDPSAIDKAMDAK